MEVLGLDVGYSNLKLAAGRSGGAPELRVMPAMAAPQAQVAAHLEGISGTDDGVAVMLDGRRWIAGVAPTRVCGWQRALHEDYTASESYRALVAAALGQVGRRQIGRLVTGLPVAQAVDAQRREALRAQLLGRHDTPAGVVEVLDVRVVAQPVGSFVDALVHAGEAVIDQISDGTVIVIDVGFFSVDWSVFVHGDLRRTATGTSLEAMSVLIEAAAEHIRTLRGGKPPAAAIERALAAGQTVIRSRGERIDLAPLLEQAARETGRVALEALRQDLRREHTNADLILLTGGGSALFEPLVRALFAGVPLHRPADPVTANARGYFYYGAR
jgi:plasmid segregation protein ParM